MYMHNYSNNNKIEENWKLTSVQIIQTNGLPRLSFWKHDGFNYFSE